LPIQEPRLAVVGEILADEDWTGVVTRVASDAPVPVVHLTDAELRPGGAGRTAMVAVQLGFTVELLTAMANEARDKEISALLTSAGVALNRINIETSTPLKMRVRARDQTLLALHTIVPEVPEPIDLEQWRTPLANADAIVLSDYGYGIAKWVGLQATLLEFSDVGKPVVWDPHPAGPIPPAGIGIVKLNSDEARRRLPWLRSPSVEQLTEEIMKQWKPRGVVVTDAGNGCYCIDSAGTGFTHIPTTHLTGIDPNGAGDAFAVSLAAALSRGEALSSACARANEDAARTMLEKSVPRRKKIGVLPRTIGMQPSVALVGGCFDVLHVGHIRVLEHARRLADRVIVALNDDASVARLKGPGRPINSAEKRREMLLSLRSVDDVVLFQEDTPAEVIRSLRPHFFVKGGDYDGRELPEQWALDEVGCKLEIGPIETGLSTTLTLRNLR
jgi:D-beta-D-heptose 7-phosphate kinase / D-beta-D-heptose 1-phosphate adenosyltransferase